MDQSAWRIPIGWGLALAAWVGAQSVQAAPCEGESLSAALLRAGRESRLQIVFDPTQVAGLCARGFTPSGDQMRDIEALARLGGFRVARIRPGLLALNRPAPVQRVLPLARHSIPPPPTRNEPASVPSQVVVTGRPAERLRFEERDSTSLTSVISIADISRRPIGNVVDAVSASTGVSTYADMGLGQSATGNPEFITVRGLDSSYNAYQFNGVVSPQSDPNSRAQSLKMASAFGVQSIAIVKTPTAEDEGGAIGGIIDIRTPTAFDVKGDLNRITVKGDLAELASRTGFNGAGDMVQAEFARRVMDGRLGVYLAAYYGQSHSVAESGEVGAWMPTDQSEAGLTNYAKVSGLSAAQYKYDFYTNDITTYGGNISIDYRGNSSTLYLRLSAVEYDDRGTDSQVSVRHGLANTGVNLKGQVVDFWGRPVGPGLSGDAAYAPQQQSQNPKWAVGGNDYNANGVYDPNGVGPGAYFQLRDQVDNLYTAQVGGKTEAERFSLAYNLSYGYSAHARPNYLEASWYGAPLEDGRVQINWANGYTPRFVFNSPAVQAYVFNQASSALWKFQGIDSASDDAVFTGRLDAGYKAEGPYFTGLHAGLKFSESDRSQYSHNLFGSGDGNLTLPTPNGYATPYWGAVGATVNEQPGQNVKGSFLGFPGLFRVFSRDALLAQASPYFYRGNYAIDPNTGLRTWPNPGAYTANDYYGGSAASRENVYAGYLSGDFAIGKVSLYPGLRFELTQFRARYWVIDTAAEGHFTSIGRSYGELLPSLNLVWRPNDRLAFRASFRRSFSRPAMGLLAGPTTVATNGVITEGNPDLKPTTALNYDASIVYYGANGATFKFAAYRKDLSHFIYAASVTGSAPQANFIDSLRNGVTYSTPENGRSAWLEGVEFEGRRQFTELPGPLAGLGLSANATLQRSNATNGRPDHYGRKTWLPRAPQIAYNLDLFWTGGRFQTDLIFQYTGRQLENLTSYNVDNYLQPRSVLDWNASADLGRYKVSVSVKNLTNSPAFWKTFGESKRYLSIQDGDGNGAYVLTGRVASLTIVTAW
ncbi:MAG: TonB-dependent receptor [Caulobacteraceae bacterium]|nr:TonB-dependent receptor [Caulobacteraceae bacterium]